MRSLSSIREILFPINRFFVNFDYYRKVKSVSSSWQEQKKILDLHFRLRSENRVKKIFSSPKVKRNICIFLEEKVGRKKRKKNKKFVEKFSRNKI